MHNEIVYTVMGKGGFGLQTRIIIKHLLEGGYIRTYTAEINHL